MSSRLDLKDIFEHLKEEQYCIVKKPIKFPKYEEGEDIDIFCYFVERVIEKLLFKLKDYPFEIKVKKENKRAYIDLLKDDKIYFRFDIYGEIPKYKNILIKDAFFSSIIENSHFENNIKVPSKIDEMIIRYLEYQEYYAQRPDKIKHIEYIKEYLNEKNKKIFFDKLHYYTELPQLDYKVKKPSFIREFLKYVKNRVLIVKNSLKSYGFKITIKKILKRLR